MITRCGAQFCLRGLRTLVATAQVQGAARPQVRYRSVLRYLRPESHMIVTTVASGPSRSATFSAATTFAPEEVPQTDPPLAQAGDTSPWHLPSRPAESRPPDQAPTAA